MKTDLSRRSLITGLISLVAAPAIVRVSSLMPVQAIDEILLHGVPITFDGGYAGLSDVTRKAFVPRLYVQLMPWSRRARISDAEWQMWMSQPALRALLENAG
jgi:hypothetical protein